MRITEKQIEYLKTLSDNKLWSLGYKMIKAKKWSYHDFGTICEIWLAIKNGDEELVQNYIKA